MTTNCSSEPATPVYILECLGLTKQDLADDPLLVLDFLIVYDRLKWVGHLARMSEDRCCKKIFLAKPMGNRARGRPPLRWIDYVGKDLNILKAKHWKTVVKSRDAWRKLLEKARTH
ncbi:hypothetical protein TNCV_3812361 [Trichonephila clavipes]|nr:hypothetical protein TNCV_3812361 [Trichonephila clavipes]